MSVFRTGKYNSTDTINMERRSRINSTTSNRTSRRPTNLIDDKKSEFLQNSSTESLCLGKFFSQIYF